MRKFVSSLLFAVCMFFVHTACAADTPVSILDKAAAKFKSAGGVNVGFTLTADGVSSTGSIRMLGSKFRASADGVTVWFDGKTMWTYVKQNEEVNVTAPSASEVARMNPYALLSIYKSGYKAAMGKSAKDYHEVVLTRQQADKPFKKIVVRVNRQNMQLMYVYMETDKASTTISITSFKNEKLGDSTFVFNKKNYPGVDVIDLR
ncbi:MAG: outer-membrane lipoprotein carrier protein LolA [Bacteroides sp.]|nr:outer-membrane lipoprotein carrier protein LolA [Roseburia sp.]MCM1345594.1 outer-membrane lipoprotein carrier protein LolA [Bacteroides sp.]MCM1421922.1 outer-membrane lipoprotein carrier protein LolA [Bacteroides sp.]